MSIERLVEERIREAMAQGEFDNLPGRGRPLDLDWYFKIPEDLRLCYSILKSGNFVPEEAQLLKEIEGLRNQLDSCSDEDRRTQIKKEINEKALGFNILLERRREKGKR